MKKGCIIALGLLLLAVGIPGAVTFSRMNREYGITDSPVVSHEAFAQPDTGLKVSVEPGHARDLIALLLAPDFKMPSWLPLDLETALDQVMPREMALLATPNYRASALDLTLFMNEKRLGPRLVEAMNAARPFARFPRIHWQKGGFSLPERGVITARGSVDLPDAFEDELLRYWSPRRRPVTAKTEGGHLFEAVLDNRHGDGFMLWVAATTMAGKDWRAVLKDPRYRQMLDLSVYVDEVRLTADLADVDTMNLHISMIADPTVGANLVGVLNMTFPLVEASLRSAYQMEIKGAFVWNEAESAIVGDYTITGIRAELKRQRDRLVAASS